MKEFKHLEQILVKYKFPRKKEEASFDIEKIVDSLKCELPRDYKYYLENFKG